MCSRRRTRSFSPAHMPARRLDTPSAGLLRFRRKRAGGRGNGSSRNRNQTSGMPVAVEGPYGPIRLKWHKLRTRLAEAPFKRSNLMLGWRLGASLEVDILATADGRFAVVHDPTLGPSTTGHGLVSGMPISSMKGLFHRNADGAGDPDAPVLSLAELLAPLRTLPRAPSANVQLDSSCSKDTAPGLGGRRRGSGRRRVGGRHRRRIAPSRGCAPSRRCHARSPAWL